MLSFPETRLAASNAAVVSSNFALIPICVSCEAKSSGHALKKVGEIVGALRDHPSTKEADIEFVSFDEVVSPRLSRIDITQRGKDTTVAATVALRLRFQSSTDFWRRLELISERFQKITQFAAPYEEEKGVDIFVQEVRLEDQKEDSERLRVIRK
ncbi:MAG TPA: hypothetical protein VHD32_00225 [Candidatus Didemnitutus sp.]|nr:hypothetical protein [Candidatus Didemnitutus sp.]